MLLVPDFMAAWQVLDARRGRVPIHDLIAFLESVTHVEVPDFYQEGVWIGDGRRDARIDLEAILPVPVLSYLSEQAIEDLTLALGKDDLEAAQRFVEAATQGRVERESDQLPSSTTMASPALTVVADFLRST